MAKIDRQIERICDYLDVISYSKDVLSTHIHLTTSGEDTRRLVQRCAEIENSVLKICEVCDEIRTERTRGWKWW